MRSPHPALLLLFLQILFVSGQITVGTKAGLSDIVANGLINPDWSKPIANEPTKIVDECKTYWRSFYVKLPFGEVFPLRKNTSHVSTQVTATQFFVGYGSLLK